MVQRTIASLLFIFPVIVSTPSGATSCDFSELKNQQKDTATIQRLKIVWTEAYLRGDTGLMSCLLAPDYTEIMRSGKVKTLSDELAMARRNRGKNQKMPELPKIQVLLHENVAIAYGNSIVERTDRKKETRWYSDSYVWKDGQWHAFFAQQTTAGVR